MSIDVRVHKKAYDEGRKTSPNSFNPNFDKHMQKVVKREEARRKAEYEKRNGRG